MVWEQNTEDFPDADGPACRMAFPTKEQYSTEPPEKKWEPLKHLYPFRNSLQQLQEAVGSQLPLGEH